MKIIIQKDGEEFTRYISLEDLIKDLKDKKEYLKKFSSEEVVDIITKSYENYNTAKADFTKKD